MQFGNMLQSIGILQFIQINIRNALCKLTWFRNRYQLEKLEWSLKSGTNFLLLHLVSLILKGKEIMTLILPLCFKKLKRQSTMLDFIV